MPPPIKSLFPHKLLELCTCTRSPNRFHRRFRVLPHHVHKTRRVLDVETGITLAKERNTRILHQNLQILRAFALLNSVQTREEKSESQQQARRSLYCSKEPASDTKARMCWLSKSKAAGDHDRVTEDLTSHAESVRGLRGES